MLWLRIVSGERRLECQFAVVLALLLNYQLEFNVQDFTTFHRKVLIKKYWHAPKVHLSYVYFKYRSLSLKSLILKYF